MKDYIDLARRPFLHFWLGVRKGGKGQDTVRRDEKTKSVASKKCRPNENQPTIQPTKPTNQSKKKKLSVVGAKWPTPSAVLGNLSSGLNLV
jgi:hypothetical protein